MAWTNSKMFAQTIADVFTQTTQMDFDTQVHKAALYNDSITPDNTVAAASTAYNTGVWGVANEQDDGTNWDAGGEPVTGLSVTPSAGVITFAGTNTPQGGASCTLANVYGCLVYNEDIATPVANQGSSYHYFGGVQSVTGGDFTIVWNASGIWAINAA